jgi:predicted Zn finger-like uncharacterized protein
MLITCPSCNTNFSVPAKAIGETGKKVKCTKCKHVWFQEPKKVDKEKIEQMLTAKGSEVVKQGDEQNNSDSSSGGVNLPVKTVKNLKYYVATIIICLLLSLIFQIMIEPDKYQSYSKYLALENYSQLKFVDFEVNSEIINKKRDFYLKGKIYNNSDIVMEIPEVHIKVLSTGGRVMNEAILSIEEKTIPPKQYINVDSDITGVSGNAAKVSLSFGNWLENTFN